ncbi:MAG: TonB-dependent receptor domain-containing protein, partial [Burkholderiales bacterium]
LTGFIVGGGATFVGNRNGDLFEPFNVPGYTRFDAFLGYRFSNRIQFSLNFENLNDKDYVNSIDSDAVFPGAPVSVFAKIELQL